MIYYYLYFTWEYIYIYYYYYLFLLEIEVCFHQLLAYCDFPDNDPTFRLQCSRSKKVHSCHSPHDFCNRLIFYFFHNFGSNNWCQACQEQLFSSYAWACVFPLICRIYSEKGPCLWSAIMDLSITFWEDEDYSGPVGLWVVWSMTSYPLPIQTH